MTEPADGSVHELAARRAEQLVRAPVRVLSAYHVAPAAGLIKLDAMENPYGWPEDMLAEWLEQLHGVAMNRYPDPAAPALKQRLREVLAVPPGCDLLLGNGSDEIIQLLVLCLAGPGRAVMAPDPTFVMYRLLTTALGGEYVAVALDANDFSLRRDAMLEALARHRPALTFIAYPNNPTGNLFARADIEAVIEAAPGLVVLDEAYEPFARRSFLNRLDHYPNLVVMRTLSKLGLAGLRLGLLVGSPAWVAQLDKLRLPYNINSLTQATVEFALSRYEVFAQQAATIRADRGSLMQALSRFPALELWPSEANFLLCRVRRGDARAVAEGLRARGVLIRVLDGSAPALAGCLRISVGTPQENEALLAGLEQVLEA
jgi:histidinol-phosphate aminotransferase